ncbi:rhomboid family intramembrane serine protease [Tenacibaculum aquimarinum]|uniref:rhomboid family intramembrane serine protease n=1 Tax=Tenacibaculum aquimarinum TaxID=2910675 RepID=UPI001F0A80B8|nr:rhomboid family intramembrane serine protease [Tenacibaculum aquimarinum]MCH3885383.1 rhomboid family intramembrane serine protease [Tenacibaculum aquimarinum]
MSFIDNIKLRFNTASIVEKLIYINLGVFLLVFLFNTGGFLFQSSNNFIIEWFALPSNFDEFLYKPWTLLTYGFLHASFLHILMNLIALYYIGNLFMQYFTPKSLISFYTLGTLFGGIVFIISYNYFPGLVKDADNSILIGASAGISAIFIGIAAYMPNYQLKFPLIGFVKLWHLALIWVALDVLQIPTGNAGGRLAHIGGALFGFLYVNQVSNKEIDIFKGIKNLFTKKEKTLKTAYKSGNKKVKKQVIKPHTQEEIDKILDKIGKSGYDTLTKSEKEFLFKQGKK